MIIRAEIADYDVGRVLIDTGSSVNVIFADAFKGLGVADSMVNRQITPLLSFSGDLVQPVGSVSLPIAFGVAPRKTMTYDQFLIVDCPTAYNVIIGRTALTRVKAHLSPHMLLMKFPTCNGTGAVRGDQLSARTCYATALKSVADRPPMEAMAVQGLPNGSRPIDDPREETPTPLAQPAEELETVVLNEEHPDRCVKIGTGLDPNLRELFIDFLRHHAEVFAWSYDDMPGISPDVICHKLSISPTCKPVRQKRRSYDTERYETMRNEVDKLKAIGFIKETTYPVWLANSVMVRKAKGGWRMCQDYTDLNKACPKDSFPLPRIDQLVDATAGHELLSFMDAYSGYNQIFMDPADNEHTAFITDRGLYCYNVMPFGLKNAGATYQRLVNRIFAQHIGSIMEVYVDDMLVKSRTAGEHLENLALMFGILKSYRMRLNPTKCAFGVSSGKFLGFMISQRGIEANPEKIKAIIDMETPKTQKDIQILTGRVAALTRFISKATDKCVPFFKALKGGKHHVAWSTECDEAFQNLKNYMSKAPLLSKPLPGEVLLLYLSVSVTAVSSVLIRKPEKAELPIFYVSKALQSAELRYPPLEQLALALVTSARRLRPYFQAHQITVLTNQPLRQIRYRSARYTIINDVLYKRGYTTPYLKCLTKEQGDYILREVHSGVCGDHSGSRSLAHKVFRQGYFWPTLHQDASEFVKKCDKCQRFGNIPHIPAEPLSPILEKAKGAWLEKLPEALWAIRTSYRTATGETPFSMAFGSEAVVPVEIGEPSYRTESFTPKANGEALALSLDLIEERRAQASLRNEAYKQRVSRYYDSRVRTRSFRIGDWVMRKVSLATKNPTEGTLGPS
ncbi:unnamed protein product, partial [Prunus brigantina]